MYGVSTSTVRLWAKKEDQHLYSIAKGKTRNLLMALDIIDAIPTIRVEELAKLVGVSWTTVNNWRKKGDIELDIQCGVCGENTTTKYCSSCVAKGWDYYVRRFEITHEELRNLPKKCEVCGSTERLHVDHDHKTNRYRGVLCPGCNVALGMVDEDISRLQKLIKYINTKKNQ